MADEAATAARDASGVRGGDRPDLEFQSTISAAVEEQTATTGLIISSVGEVAHSSHEIVGRLDEVAGVAESTRNGAKAAQDSAHELGRTAHALSSLVSTIRY